MNPEWIVFDLGGVVLDVDFQQFFATLPSGLGAGARQKAAEIVRVFRTYEEQSGALPPESVFDELRKLIGMELTDREIAEAVNAVLGRQRPEMLQAITSLSERYNVACLSNTNHIHWEVLLEKYPVMNCFQEKLASHLLGYSKPDLRIYRKAEELLKARPEGLIFFDDKGENIQAAIEAGWRAFVFTDVQRFKDDLRRCGIEV